MASIPRQRSVPAFRRRPALIKPPVLGKWSAGVSMGIVLSAVIFLPIGCLLLPADMAGWMFSLTSGMVSLVIFMAIRSGTSGS